MYEYRDPYILDFSKVQDFREVHKIIKDGLDFPDYYGENWSAFWDCITDMVGDEKLHIQIIGYANLQKRYPDMAEKLTELLERARHYYDDACADDVHIEYVER